MWQTVTQEGFSRRARPIPVTLIAFFQFFKAAYLLFILRRVWATDNAALASSQNTGNYLLQNPLLILIPAASICFVVIGCGLWRLQKWARSTLIFTMLDCWAVGFISFNGLFFGKSIWMDDWPLKTTILVFLLDFLVFGCLVLYPDVTEAFDNQNAKRADSDSGTW